jgi:cytochrome P450
MSARSNAAAVNLPEPPGRKRRWFVGNLFEFRSDRLGFLLRTARQYGPMARFWVASQPFVLVSEPALVEQVLVTQNKKFGKGRGFRLLRSVLGNGLVTSEGDLWLRQRRLMQPAFQRAQVEAYGPTIVEQTQRHLAGWQAGQTLELHHEMMRLTLAIAAKAFLGIEAVNRFEGVANAIDLLMEDFLYRVGTMMPISRRIPTPWNRRVKAQIERVDRLMYDIIAERRRSPLTGTDVLTRMMKAQDAAAESQPEATGMSDQQLRDEVVTLLSAGHETTANALTWIWYLLGQHPEVVTRLSAELHEVLGDRDPTTADLPRLKYTEYVVQEVMRLYPAAYGMGRLALEPLELGSYLITPGTTCFLSQWVSHRDERYFPQPEEFRPERWENDLARRIPKFAYYPFGGGPRVCIGSTLAMIEVVLVVATIARRFRFELAADQQVVPWPSVTLRPRNGVRAICREATKLEQPASRAATTMASTETTPTSELPNRP